MEKPRLFFFLITLFLYITISSILSCSNSEIKSENYGQNELSKKISLRFTSERNIELPSGRFNDYQIFISDCRGNSDPEIIVVSNSYLQISTLQGEPLLEKSLKFSFYKPAFVRDMDGDNKSDVIFGTADALKNKIVVVNGMGNIISQYDGNGSNRAFSSIIPIGVYNNYLFAIARPDTVESERGILCLDPFSLKKQFLFFTPDPVGLLIIGKYIIPSYQIHDNGLFIKYGKNPDGIIKSNFESNGMLLEISLKGERLHEYQIIEDHKEAEGIMDYRVIPESKNILLYHHTSLQETTDPHYCIYMINSETGKIIRKSKVFNNRLLNFASLPASTGYLSIVSAQNSKGFTLNLLGKDLKQQEVFHPKEKPAFVDTNGFPFKTDFPFFFLLSDGLYSMDNKIVFQKAIDHEEYTHCVFFLFNKQTYAALGGKNSIAIYLIH